MASVVRNPRTETWIDRSLDLLTSEWAAIPELAGRWTAWDEEDRLDFVLEWPLREDRLRLLRQWHAEGRLTETQRRRYDALQALVQQHQETLASLVSD